MAEVGVEVGIDGKAFNQSVKQMETSINSLGKSIEKTFSESSRSVETFKGTLAGLAAFKAGELIVSGFNKIGQAISDSIGIAAEKEVELAKLENALIRAGLGGKKAVENFSDFADAIEKTTKFTDEAALSSVSLLANLTKLDQNGIKVAVKSATDLAAVLGTDLDSATRILIKASEGSVTALQRQGIAIEKGKTNAETYANTLKAIEKFAGAAATETNTFSGAFGQLAKASENVLESLGNIVVKNPLIIGIFKTLTESLGGLDDSVKESFSSLQSFFNGGINFSLAFSKAFIDSLDFIYKAVRGIGVGIINFVTGPIRVFARALIEVADIGGQALSVFDDKLGASVQKTVSKARQMSEALEKGLNIGEAFTDDSFLTKASKNLDSFAVKANSFYVEQGSQSEANKNKRIQDEQEASAQILAERQKLLFDISALEAQVANEKQFGQAALEVLDPTAEAELVFQREQAKAVAELEVQLQKNKELTDIENKRLADKQAKLNEELKSTQNFNNLQNTLTKNARAQELSDRNAFYNSAISLSTAKNKELAAIGKAFAIQNAIMQGYEAVQGSYRFGALTGGPFLGATFAAIAAAATAANVAKIAGVQFAEGGIVPGNSYTGDNVAARLNSSEMVLNRQQQAQLFRQANGEGGSNDSLLGAISALGDRIERMNITVVANGRELARLMNEEKRSGFAFS